MGSTDENQGYRFGPGPVPGKEVRVGSCRGGWWSQVSVKAAEVAGREPEVSWQRQADLGGHEKGSKGHPQTQVVLSSVIGRWMLISEICEFVILYDKKDIANGISLRILRWEIIWHYPGGSNLIARVLINGRQDSQRWERCDDGSS